MIEMEKNDLRAFLEMFGNINEQDCEFTDVPDLLMPFEGSIVGVEHTRLYRENPALKSGGQLMPQEALQAQIISRARENFRRVSPTLLTLLVSFVEPFDYRKSDIVTVAGELEQAVLESLSLFNDPLSRGEVIWVWEWEFRRLGRPFPQGVKCLSIRVESSPGMEIWGPAYGYAVPSLPYETVESIIRRKDSRIEEYRARCDKVWLLIVTETGMPSSHYDITNEVAGRRYQTKFDRLFLLTLFKQKLVELQISPMP